LVNIFPTNPIAAMAEGNMLQIIVFSLLFGIALKSLGTAGDSLKNSFETINNVILSLVKMLIELAPYGIFALLFSLFAVQGFGMIGDLAKYFFLLVFVLIFHAFVTYGSLLSLLARLNPVRFFMKVRSLAVFAFTTSSSSATMPITLDTVKNKLGVKSSIGSFTVPLGATINMDGTAIMQGVATVFISQAYNIDLSMVDYLMVILTATLASIGTAGVPGVGLIMLAMVLEQVGLPVEGIALIIGVDRLLDMTRTAVNVCGDAMVSCVVAISEDEFDAETFQSEK
jgi:Na+/H+-dicarboxylate symporter